MGPTFFFKIQIRISTTKTYTDPNPPTSDCLRPAPYLPRRAAHASPQPGEIFRRPNLFLTALSCLSHGGENSWFWHFAGLSPSVRGGPVSPAHPTTKKQPEQLLSAVEICIGFFFLLKSHISIFLDAVRQFNTESFKLNFHDQIVK